MKNYGVKAYDTQIENYARSDSNEIEGLSKYLIEKAYQAEIDIEEDENTLPHQAKNDIRKNIPPQIYLLISGMIDAIEHLEAVDNES